MRNSSQATTSNATALPPFGMPPSALLNSLPTSTSSSTTAVGFGAPSRAPQMQNNNSSSLFANLMAQQQKLGSNGPMLNVNDNEFPSLGAQHARDLSATRSSTSQAPAMNNAFVNHTSPSLQSFQSSMPPPPSMSQMQTSMFMKEAQQHNNRPAYANLMKQDGVYGGQQPAEGFQMASEDFPALGGGIANGVTAMSNASVDTVNFLASLQSTPVGPIDLAGGLRLPPQPVSKPNNTAVEQHQLNVEHISNGPPRGTSPSVPQTNGPISSKPRQDGVQTEPNGRVYNIPPGMLNDQFGMAGLLTFLRAIETDPGIVALALGHDLTTLGLNLNAHEKNLYQSFGGPWADSPCRAADIDVHIPEEYATNAAIRDKLPGVKLNRFTDDLLFYIFYTYPGELFQMAAASELFTRDWRYHRHDRVWVTRAPYSQSHEQTPSYERGTYYVFDSQLWRKTTKEMTLEYAKLEDRPPMPQPNAPSMGASGQQHQQLPNPGHHGSSNSSTGMTQQQQYQMHVQQQLIMQQMQQRQGGGKSVESSAVSPHAMMGAQQSSAVTRSSTTTS